MIDFTSSAVGYASIGGAAHLPAAMRAEAPTRALRRRAHAAALSSVPRVGIRVVTR